MWDMAKNSSSRRKTISFIKRHAMKRNGTGDKKLQKGKNLNNFKARVSNPKEISSRKGLLLK